MMAEHPDLLQTMDAPRPRNALTIRIEGEIRGKGRPRFSRHGNHVRTFTDGKTESAENWVRACAVRQVGQPMLEGALSLRVSITVGIPVSWSKRKQDEARMGLVRPTGKPDADNTLKMLADALNGIVWRDDSQIVDVFLSKYYGAEPGAVIELSYSAGIPLRESAGQPMRAARVRKAKPRARLPADPVPSFDPDADYSHLPPIGTERGW